MRRGPECVSCILSVRMREITRFIGDPERAVEAQIELLSVAAEAFRAEEELTRIASRIYMWLVESYPEVAEGMRRLRARSIEAAWRQLPALKGFLERFSGYEKYRLAARISIAGNILDTGVAGHRPGETISLDQVLATPLAIDDTVETYHLLSRGGKTIVWLFDNAGEAVYDTLFIEVIRGMGNRVIGVAKQDPGFQNDLTYRDAVEHGVASALDELLSTGYPGSSIHLDSVDPGVLDTIRSADLVVAKGMAHYEYLSTISVERLGAPVLHMLIPKCLRVAESLGVEKGVFVHLLRTR